jgi:hypothetical protein
VEQLADVLPMLGEVADVTQRLRRLIPRTARRRWRAVRHPAENISLSSAPVCYESVDEGGSTMKRHIVAAAAAALAIGLTGLADAAAPCQFAAGQEYIHPAKAAKLTAPLVQTFVSCNNPGGRTANSETETGTNSCVPAETIAHFDYVGSVPQGTWVWGPKSQGRVSFKAGKNKITTGETATLSDEEKANARDLYIRVNMSDIRDEQGSVINSGAARLYSFIRVTLVDRAESKVMTIFDFPIAIDLPAVKGSVNVKTSVTEAFDDLGWPALARCATIELVALRIVDPNGSRFAAIGMFLP